MPGPYGLVSDGVINCLIEYYIDLPEEAGRFLWIRI